MENKRKRVCILKSRGRWNVIPATDGTLRELKESTAKLRKEVKKESRIFSKYSLIDGGKKIASV